MTTTAVVKKNRGISPIWTLPLIALCICGWLVYSAYKNAGVEITITFADASGIVPEKTQIMARGIPIGIVMELADISGRTTQNRVSSTRLGAASFAIFTMTLT